MDYNEAVIDAGAESVESISMLLEDYKERMEEAMDAALDWGTSDDDFGAMLGAPRAPRTIRQTVDPMAAMFGAGTQLEQQAMGGGEAVASGLNTLKNVVKNGKRAGKRLSKVDNWLNKDVHKGELIWVYLRPNGRSGYDYVGITNDIERRGYEHGVRLRPIAGPFTTRRRARAVETLMMINNPWLMRKGGNRIYSVSSQNPLFDEVMGWAAKQKITWPSR